MSDDEPAQPKAPAGEKRATKKRGNKKKRAKKKRAAKPAERKAKKTVASDEPEGSGAEASADEPEAPDAPSKDTEEDEPKPRRWWILLVVIGLVELFLFGSRGKLRVCVARDGEHDFALVDQPRTEDNTRQYPTCETRTNVGIVSKYEEARDHATLTACRRATVLRPQNAVYQCALKQDGWQHRIEEHFVPPWDPVYYKRLFWFAFD